MNGLIEFLSGGPASAIAAGAFVFFGVLLPLWRARRGRAGLDVHYTPRGHERQLTIADTMQLMARNNDESLRQAYQWRRRGSRGVVDLGSSSGWEERVVSAPWIRAHKTRAAAMGIRIVDQKMDYQEEQ